MNVAALYAVAGDSTMMNAVLAVAAACSGGGLAAIVQWLSNRGKTTAEEVEIWTRSSVTRLQTMHEEMTLLEKRIRELNAELESERTTRIERTAQLQHAKELLALHGIAWDPGHVTPR